MASGKIVVGTERKAPQAHRPDLERAWRLLVPVAVLFMVAGFMDLSLALFPPQLGSADWRFSAATVAVTGWPLVLVGATVLAVAAAGDGNRPALRWIGVVLNALCLVVMVFAVVALLAGWEGALARVPEAVKTGLNKSVIKASIAAALYAGCHTLAIRSAFRGGSAAGPLT